MSRRARIVSIVSLITFLASIGPSLFDRTRAEQSTEIPTVVGADQVPWLPQFRKRPADTFAGQYIASDPSILMDDGLYRLYYTCFIVPDSGFVPEDVRAGICSATSSDGINWSAVDTGNASTPGLVLRGREGTWQENLEAAYVVQIDDTVLLYYSGYETEGDPALGYPAKLSVASSSDGVTFERVTNDPILSPTPGWYDNDAIYSPVVVVAGEQLAMVYAGHCYTDCQVGWGVTLLGATSQDGLQWTKLDQPVLQGTSLGLDWTRDGVAEPALLFGPTGEWLLFFTALEDASREIGLAFGPAPFGPWTVIDTPIMGPSPGTFDEGGVLAPFVVLEGDRWRMWYLGQSIGEQQLAIGYAEAIAPEGADEGEPQRSKIR